MATTNHGITVPTVGASTDTWGTEGNLCWTTLDSRTPSLTGFKIDGTTPLPFTGAQCFAVGSAAAPGIQFSGDTNTGFYWIGADSIGMSLGGTLRTTFATTGITSTGGFSGTTGTFSGALSATTGTFTGLVLTPASATGGAGLRLPHGAAPTSPTNGDMWTTTSGLFVRINSATQTLLTSTGNAATATALATGRTISLTGDVTATTSSFDGTANVSGAATIANSAVTLAKMANMATASVLGRNTAGTGAPEVLSVATLSTMLNTGGAINLSAATITTNDITGDGYIKLGNFYLMWGTSASTTRDGPVTVTLPATVAAVLTAHATQRNTASSSTLNMIVGYVSDTTTSITFYQNDFTSSSAPEGFNWWCLATAT